MKKLDCEQSLFCSKICGEERKKVSERDIREEDGGLGEAIGEAASRVLLRVQIFETARSLVKSLTIFLFA